MKCATCPDKKCYQGRVCVDYRAETRAEYEDETNYKIMRAAAAVDAYYYMQMTRVEETIKFAQEMGYRHLGMAFCIGLAREARILHEIFASHFVLDSVCCKVCGMDKGEFDLPKVKEGRYEATCNPVGQAMVLNERGTELNIVVGLCVGHDILFAKYSRAPVTTLVVKDRVLAHNPLGAIYSGYYLENRFGR